MPLLWRSTHCRGRRKVEEYSSSEVPDSDNNSIKESVEFSESSFRMNFSESLLGAASETELLIFHFPLEVTSTERGRESPSDRTQKISWSWCFSIENTERYL